MFRFRLLTSAFVAVAPVVRAQSPVIRSPVAGAPSGAMAFVDVAVLPMDTERVLPDQTVVIRDGRIVALGPTSRVNVPAGAARIDGRGKFLLPGLADCHAHIAPNSTGEKVFGDSLRALAERRLFLYLASGVTMIRNADFNAQPNADDDTLMLALRAKAAAGTLWSPRIRTSGHLWGRRNFKDAPVAPESVATYVAAYKAAGYDFIKIHPTFPEFRWKPDSITTVAVAEMARRLQMPVTGHIPSSASLPFESATQSYTLVDHLATAFGGNEHKVHYDLPALRTMAATTRRAGLWNCPTLAVHATSAMMDIGSPYYMMPSHVRYVKALQEAGAGLLLGTDAIEGTLLGEPGVSIPLELHALVHAGLTPYQALLTATRNAATYFQTLVETGTIALGKRADLVLLTGNPLADVRHTERPAGVMIGGRWLDRAAIDVQLARRIPGPAADKAYYWGLVDEMRSVVSARLDSLSLTWHQETVRRQFELGIGRVMASYWQGIVGSLPSVMDEIVSPGFPGAWPGAWQGFTWSDAQRQAYEELGAKWAQEWQPFVDSLRGKDRMDVATQQRARQWMATRLGGVRAVLTSAQQPGFDARARVWLARHAQQGYQVTIPGLQP